MDARKSVFFFVPFQSSSFPSSSEFQNSHDYPIFLLLPLILRFPLLELAPIMQPEVVELLLRDLGALAPRESGHLERQLAHLQVVFAGDEKDGLLVRVDFHLSRDVGPVEVRVPNGTVVGLVEAQSWNMARISKSIIYLEHI